LSLRRSLFRQCSLISNQKPVDSISNTHSFVTSQKSMIPMLSDLQLKTNRLHFQYVFPCHFAEVYSVNALKSPIKNQSIPFPIRLPFQYAFLSNTQKSIATIPEPQIHRTKLLNPLSVFLAFNNLQVRN
jgi:hypothetical protein